MTTWNAALEPIANRLRDDNELRLVQDNKSLIYHQETKRTALIMDVWIVDPVEGEPDTNEEDRYVRYTTETEVKTDFAVDLDDEGWIWYDGITKEEL